mmetsp:Transcript_32084/g.76248  ORF Transcript_32084/g.76248 Transcript_32084/m.76248 type:complete len:249 (-) Transcript_32084:569-1315(-)
MKRAETMEREAVANRAICPAAGWLPASPTARRPPLGSQAMHLTLTPSGSLQARSSGRSTGRICALRLGCGDVRCSIMTCDDRSNARATARPSGCQAASTSIPLPSQRHGLLRQVCVSQMRNCSQGPPEIRYAPQGDHRSSEMPGSMVRMCVPVPRAACQTSIPPVMLEEDARRRPQGLHESASTGPVPSPLRKVIQADPLPVPDGCSLCTPWNPAGPPPMVQRQTPRRQPTAIVHPWGGRHATAPTCR